MLKQPRTRRKNLKRSNISPEYLWNTRGTVAHILRTEFRVRAVLKWLSKNQCQGDYSNQSQQQQTARWTNQYYSQLSIICWKRGKNRPYMVGLVLVLLLICWKNGPREIFKPITKRSYRNRVIRFDSHLKTALSSASERMITHVREECFLEPCLPKSLKLRFCAWRTKIKWNF